MFAWLIPLLLAVAYPYFIYPFLLALVSRRKPFENKGLGCESSPLPKVSFLVALYNEQERLPEKIANTLRCDYPADRIQFIFVSDGSDDGSDALVAAQPALTLVRTGGRVGKEQALAKAMAVAAGDIFVFSDVGTLLKPDAIRRFVENFDDPACGAVSSYDDIDESRLSLEGGFVRLEMMIREWEARLSSCVGVSGSLFAARAELARQLRPDHCSDLSIAFICVRNGFRATIDRRIRGTYRKAQSATIEFGRKKRTVVHGVNTVVANLGLLNPVRYGWFSWQLFSHKIMRWLSPMFFSLAALLVLYRAVGFTLGFLPFSADFSVLAFISLLLAGLLILRMPGMSNARFALASSMAVYSALLDILRGRSHALWSPTRRNGNGT